MGRWTAVTPAALVLVWAGAMIVWILACYLVRR